MLSLVADTGIRADDSWRALLRENRAAVIAAGGQLAAAYLLLKEKGLREFVMPDPDELESEIEKILAQAR